ncbi:MAG: permease prefix domain 1-containing protein [Spirochaetes bacterium]|nr:permease prefix domain 1-containing protein [Spirochaetota bacterium]
MFDLEDSVRAWTDGLRSRGAFRAEDIVELEGHLREEIDGLVKVGLNGEEAFLVAERRIGRPEALAAEYAKVHGEPWRGMPFDALTEGDRRHLRRELILVAALALAAALLAQVPRLFGADLYHSSTSVPWMKNLSLFFMPLVAVYYAVRSRPKPFLLVVAAVLFAAAGLLVNLYPWPAPDRQTLVLAALHLPVMLWLVVGLAYTAGRWRDDGARMDFLRATGEAFIYGTLILCGGAVLTAFTIAMFSAVGLDIRQSYLETVGIGGMVAAPVVAVFLVNAKKSIVENIAPVLSRIFTPLFLATMIAFLAVMAALHRSPLSDRDTLFAFNVMLVLVLALVIYNLTARRAAERREWTDWLNLALIACSAAVDAIALASIIGRILSFGWSPNRAALLGLNVVLLADLAGLAMYTLRFLAGRGTFTGIERWQSRYLPVLFGWCAVVVVVFPPVFAFA